MCERGRERKKSGVDRVGEEKGMRDRKGGKERDERPSDPRFWTILEPLFAVLSLILERIVRNEVFDRFSLTRPMPDGTFHQPISG